MKKPNLSKRFIKYMSNHLGHNFWITPNWAADYYIDYCLLGERKSITLDPNYQKIVKAMEEKMDEIAGGKQKEQQNPYKYMRNPNWCGTFTSKPSLLLNKLRKNKENIK